MNIETRSLPHARTIQFSRLVEGTDYDPTALLRAAADHLAESGDTLIGLDYEYDGQDGREYLNVTTEPERPASLT